MKTNQGVRSYFLLTNFIEVTRFFVNGNCERVTLKCGGGIE